MYNVYCICIIFIKYKYRLKAIQKKEGRNLIAT